MKILFAFVMNWLFVNGQIMTRSSMFAGSSPGVGDAFTPLSSLGQCAQQQYAGVRYCQFPGFSTAFKVEIVQCHNEHSVSVSDSCRVGNKIRGNFAGLFTPCIEFTDQVICPEMCVPFQHVQGAVTGNGCNLHNVQCAELEQTADGLMAEIVKMQIFYFQIQKSGTPGAFETGRGVKLNTLPFICCGRICR